MKITKKKLQLALLKEWCLKNYKATNYMGRIKNYLANPETLPKTNLLDENVLLVLKDYKEQYEEFLKVSNKLKQSYFKMSHFIFIEGKDLPNHISNIDFIIEKEKNEP